jgi:uncharacterized RDD family membrane protein YckC
VHLKMTCQACQTWNEDDEHRCRRCGRRIRSTPSRYVRDAYPIAATALAYKAELIEDNGPVEAAVHLDDSGAQQVLFNNARGEARVIPFEHLTSPAERESIRARGAQIPRPEPVRTAKGEVSAKRARRSRLEREDQQRLDLFGKAEVFNTPKSSIQCGAPVAPPSQRLNAALLDGFIIFLATLCFLGVFRLAAGVLPADKYALMAYGVAFASLAITYKLLWCFANRDSFGVSAARLRIVDLDGNPPTQKRRFWRAAGSCLSLGAVGLGIIWAFADADGLAWHDQISGTFPTFCDE